MINPSKKNPPGIARKLLQMVVKQVKDDSFVGDCDEVYQIKSELGGKLQAGLWYWTQVIKSIPSLIQNRLAWSFFIFMNNMKVAFRNIKRHKGYSFINIAGLAVGLTCCILILLYIQFELSYDTYHKDTNRIFRIAFENNSKSGIRFFTITPGALAPVIKENYPEVEYAVRVRGKNSLVKSGENSFYENNFMYADQSIFNIFSIPLIIGDASTAIKRPYTIIITEDIAGKYFGNTDPIGNLLAIDGQDYTITGIAANPPQNTHLKYSIISSMISIEDDDELTNWNYLNCYTYVKLKEQVKLENFEKKISNISHLYQGEKSKKSGTVTTHYLQPLTSIHLQPQTLGGEPPCNPVYLYIFSIVCVFILIIACINFINLTTARAIKRTKEIGMRKVIGADRHQLALQFLGDACLISLFASLLAFLIVCLSLRYFSTLVGIEFSLSILFKPVMILMFTGLILFTGIAAGSYPALFLSALKPIIILKGVQNPGSGKSIVRRTLVVFQFTISIILMIVSVFIYEQNHFMKNKSLGFEKEQKLIIRVRDSKFLRKNFETVKNEFLRHSDISGATVLYYPPGIRPAQWGWGTLIERDENSLRIEILPVDYDYIKAYNIKIAAGRDFQRGITTDTTDAILINKTAMKALGFSNPEEAVNKRTRKSVTSHAEIANELKIVGVTDDFHFYDLKSKILPVMMVLNPFFDNISLTVNTVNFTETISFVKNKWNELFPGRPCEYYFLDERIDTQFHIEEQTGRIFGIFTFIGIFIACLGLLGLASFIAEQRTKEIGVRKVLGSSIVEVVTLLTKDFTKWVLLANLFAWPIAYFAVYKWLQNFAYKINIGISVFIISSASTLLMALLTVGYQTIKAAKANPVDSLRCE